MLCGASYIGNVYVSRSTMRNFESNDIWISCIGANSDFAAERRTVLYRFYTGRILPTPKPEENRQWLRLCD